MAGFFGRSDSCDCVGRRTVPGVGVDGATIPDECRLGTLGPLDGEADVVLRVGLAPSRAENRQGGVDLTVRHAGDREVVAIPGFAPIELDGVQARFDGLGRSAEARALEASTVISVPYEPVRAVYEDRPEALWSVVKLLVGRLRSMDEALADSVFLDVTGRTAKRLLEMAGESDEFILPVTQEELAGMVGASRERVNKAIASFVKLGWIDQSDRRYVITNREQLSIRSR